MRYTNSPLATYTKISPNRTSPRNHKIDTITIHCVVGQVTVERLGEIFSKPSRKASCNYGIGLDGQIALIVPESDRSWCSSNRDNDHRAITIEVASDTKAPYKVSDKALNTLIRLCADICQRNDIKCLKWQNNKALIGQVDKQNMTVHRWFANKSCPGDYLMEKHPYIVREVNKILGVVAVTEDKPTPYIVRITALALNVREGAGTKYKRKTTVFKNQKYTIVEEKDGWGKLKSGAGWISLKYAERI